MDAERNKRVVERFLELGVDEIDDLVAENFIDHTPQTGQGLGREGLKQIIREHEAMVEESSVVHDMVAHRDRVYVHWTTQGTDAHEFGGLKPTGRTIQLSGVTIYRVQDEKIAERWNYANALQVMADEGLLPGFPELMREAQKKHRQGGGKPSGAQQTGCSTLIASALAAALGAALTRTLRRQT